LGNVVDTKIQLLVSKLRYQIKNQAKRNQSNKTDIPNRCKVDTEWTEELPPVKGTAAPIVSFRQLSKVISTFDGSGVLGVLSSELKTAELLYPSRVSATLLAR